MEKTLAIINQLEKSGLVLLTPVYDYLAQRGYAAQGEAVIIEGRPVQFLPVYNELIQETLEQATERR